jgi:hypothetical protein
MRKRSPAPAPGSITATDNCGGGATVTHVGDVMTGQTCANRFNIIRTYQATDACGNSATCTQTISVFDNVPPSLTCPGNVTVQCANLLPAPDVASVMSSDNCGGTATVTHVGDVMSNMTCTNRFNVTRTYRATDACGNSATCTQTITVFDSTPPALTCPGNVTVQCASQIPAPNVEQNFSTTDNCGVASISFGGDVTVNQTCVNRFNVIRTYRATDDCGNSASCTQTIIVFDNTPPSIVCPQNVTVQCANAVPAPSTTSITTSTDNCGGATTITHVGDVMSNMTCTNRFNITRTYRATDACGNSATCSQIITVFDSTPPSSLVLPTLQFSAQNRFLLQTRPLSRLLTFVEEWQQLHTLVIRISDSHVRIVTMYYVHTELLTNVVIQLRVLRQLLSLIIYRLY